MKIRFARPLMLTGLFVAAFAVAGCGGGKVKVKGKVTLNGKPLVWGTITMVDSTGTPHQTFIGLDGTYTMEDGVPAGPVKIGVISPKPQDPAGRGGGAGAGAGGGDKKGTGGGMPDPRDEFLKKQGITPDKGPNRPMPPAGAWFPIPDKYADPNSSGLSDTVKSGTDVNVDLK